MIFSKFDSTVSPPGRCSPCSGSPSPFHRGISPEDFNFRLHMARRNLIHKRSSDCFYDNMACAFVFTRCKSKSGWTIRCRNTALVTSQSGDSCTNNTHYVKLGNLRIVKRGTNCEIRGPEQDLEDKARQHRISHLPIRR